MTNQAKPGRSPVHDLAAFDLSKRSPEQLARSFAHWKAQRKRPLEEPRAGQALQAQSDAAVAKDTDPSPADDAAKPSLSKRARPVEYSSTFSDLLAAGSEPTVQREDPPPIVARPAPKRAPTPARRLMAMSALAGAASLLALAGGAVLELSDWRDPVEVAPEVARIEPRQAAAPLPIVTAAAGAPETEWTLQRIVDLALMKAAVEMSPSAPARPKPPEIQTASKAEESKPTTPTPEKDTLKSVPFVVKPFVPSPASTPTARSPVTPAPPVTAAYDGDPRPDALVQHNRSKSTAGNGAISNHEASGDKPAAATGSKSAVDSPSATTRTATARSKTAVSTGRGDPRGEISGGARAGVSGEAGESVGDADASGATAVGGGNTGTPNGGSAASDAGADGTGDGSTGDSGTGSSDTGSTGTGSSDAGSSGAGGSAAGSDGSGDDNDSGDGESDSGDGEDGNSGGIGGAIGGALDGIGDALGGALGGDKGNPDSNDKDQRN